MESARRCWRRYAAHIRESHSDNTKGFWNQWSESIRRFLATWVRGVSSRLSPAIVGPESAKLELLSAGHAPLFIYWLRHDRFDKMEAQGLPLGISPEFQSEPPQLLPFDSGDLLVLTTDGFFEWANGSEKLFGTERLENSVRANRDKPAAEIISNLYQDVLNFAGGTAQKDDLTAIVIKRL